MNKKKILVIGGLGYIGREIVAKLIEENYEVTVLSRNPKKNKRIKIIKGNVLDKEGLTNKVKGFYTVIYLAAIIRSFNKSKYKENAIGVKNIVEVMHLNKINKIIYFSTQSVHIKKTGPYGNSKKQCEKIILSSDLDYTIIRPNYVYGIDKQNDFYRLMKIIKKIRICPIIGCGDNKFQPINKKDVAQITVNLVKRFKPKSIIDISGKTTLSINEVVDYIAKQTKNRFIKIYIPIIFLKLFRKIIPFDVDGFTADTISILGDIPYKTSSNLQEDLNKIFRL